MQVNFSCLWSEHKQRILYLARQAYFRSYQKGSFDIEDFVQEAALTIFRCLPRYQDSLPTALLCRIVKNRFGTILHSQYLEAKYVAQYMLPDESSEIPTLTPYILLSQELSPLAQQVLWLLVDPPDSLWERACLQETVKISRKIIAEELGVAPQRVSEAARELREALQGARIFNA